MKQKLIPLEETPNNLYSRKKILFQCECGNIKRIMWKHYISNKTKSCGLCPRSNEDHKTELIDKSTWLLKYPELINRNLPESWPKDYSKNCKFKCGCGNIISIKFKQYKKGISKCSECNKIKITDLINKKFNKLQLLSDQELPDTISLYSPKKYKFKCECGNIKYIQLYLVTKNIVKSCGQCNKINIYNKRYGRLTVIDNIGLIGKYSEHIVKCKCDCGLIHEVMVTDLIRGRIKSCGNCYGNLKKWWINKKEPSYYIENKYLQLKNKYTLEFLYEYFKNSFITPLESCNNTHDLIDFKCNCGKIFKHTLSKVYHYKIVSCGCIKTSFMNVDIALYIKSLGIDCQYGKNEYKINNYKYDIFIPSHNLLIELNGLKYHDESRKLADIKKYRLAIKNGCDYLMVYEDEWKHKKDIVKNIIKNKLKLNKPLITRPRHCLIKLISNNEVNSLYEKYHYIGKCMSTHNIGAYYDNKLIACMSIRKPVRPKSGDFEISRMACDFNYKIHGLWSFLLKWIKRNNLFSGKLVTFSDNRLSNGNVYQKMGMSKEKEIRSDYYWVKNNRRHNKSSLRKTKSERITNLTETQLRINQGYNKIYDLGKIKWSISI